MTNIVSNKVGTHIQNVLALALDNAIKQKESCTFWHFLREGNLGGLIGTIGRSAQAAQLGRALGASPVFVWSHRIFLQNRVKILEF